MISLVNALVNVNSPSYITKSRLSQKNKINNCLKLNWHMWLRPRPLRARECVRLTL